MSSQSGISVSPSLAKEFPEFVDSEDIAAILAINHAKEHVELQHRIAGSVSDVQKHLGEGNEAKYIILRLPNEQSFGFIQFMPDAAPLSSKMKYASSHATIHRQLGGSSTFSTTIFWTDLDEVSNKGLDTHWVHEDAPAPLTEEEQNLATAIELESAQGSRGHSVANQSMLSIHANVSKSAISALNKLEGDSALILKVSSDESESIELVSECSVGELATQFSDTTEPRYVVAKIKRKNLFAFVCPRESTIKHRMLFASTRISFLEFLKKEVGIDATIETFEPKQDLQKSNLASEVGPAEDAPAVPVPSLHTKPKFQRPRPPKRANK